MSAVETEVQQDQHFTSLGHYQFTGDETTVDIKRRFIESLRDKFAVYLAAKQAGIHKATAYKWRDLDPEFAEAWDEAQEDSVEVMQSSVYERALGSNGNKPDNLLAMFWLKAHLPKYRDKVVVDVSSIQEQIDLMMSKLDTVQRQQLPPAITSFIDTEFNTQTQEYHSPREASDPRLEQKEESPE